MFIRATGPCYSKKNPKLWVSGFQVDVLKLIKPPYIDLNKVNPLKTQERDFNLGYFKPVGQCRLLTRIIPLRL